MIFKAHQIVVLNRFFNKFQKLLTIFKTQSKAPLKSHCITFQNILNKLPITDNQYSNTDIRFLNIVAITSKTIFTTLPQNHTSSQDLVNSQLSLSNHIVIIFMNQLKVSHIQLNINFISSQNFSFK
jgi:hypothetical protein